MCHAVDIERLALPMLLPLYQLEQEIAIASESETAVGADSAIPASNSSCSEMLHVASLPSMSSSPDHWSFTAQDPQ